MLKTVNIFVEILMHLFRILWWMNILCL